MRIESGLQGYYYDQGRFQKPAVDADEAAPTQTTAPVRNPSFSPQVGSSTLLSSTLSGALWALDGGRKPAGTNGFAAPGSLHGSDEVDADHHDTMARVNALYLDEDDTVEHELLYA
ncbi:hypothetical protein LJR030_001666 [Rhizobium sp. LjRoot30]|uniref:hypothetical protein n=1 Tax=Rhizobium sp. LjRoot30 TaxID=3342320 RepID=UPI003ECE35D8